MPTEPTMVERAARAAPSVQIIDNLSLWRREVWIEGRLSSWESGQSIGLRGRPFPDTALAPAPEGTGTGEMG